MERQNVTLSIPKDLLIKARHLAVNKDTSLSGLLTATLREIIAREEGYEEARNRQIALMETGLDLGLHGDVKWTREEIHERQ